MAKGIKLTGSSIQVTGSVYASSSGLTGHSFKVPDNGTGTNAFKVTMGSQDLIEARYHVAALRNAEAHNSLVLDRGSDSYLKGPASSNRGFITKVVGQWSAWGGDGSSIANAYGNAFRVAGYSPDNSNDFDYDYFRVSAALSGTIEANLSGSGYFNVNNKEGDKTYLSISGSNDSIKLSGSTIQVTGSTQIEVNEDSTQVFEIKGAESGTDNRIVHDYFRVESANAESSRKIYIGRAIGDTSAGASRYISLASNEIIVKCQNATIDLDTNGITTTTYGNQLWKLDTAQNYTYKFQAKRSGEGTWSTPFEIDGDNNAATFIIRPTGSAGSSDITTAGSFLVKDTSDNEYFKVNLSASSNGSVESILSGDQIRLRYDGYDYIKVGEKSIGSGTTGIQISSQASDYIRLRSEGGSGNWIDLDGYTTTIAAFSATGIVSNLLYQDGTIFDVRSNASSTARYIEVKRGADTVRFSGSSIQMTGSTYFDDEVYIKTGASETPLTLQVGSSTSSVLRFQGNSSNTLKYSVGQGGGWYHSFLSNNTERFLIGDNYSAFRNSVQVTGSLNVSTNITASGTVSASAFYGDGSNLTGISAGGSGISDLVEDTSPQLGGTLDVNGQEISGSTVSLVSDTLELTGSKFLFSSSQTNDVGLVFDASNLTLRHGASSVTVKSSNAVSISNGNLQAGAGVWVSDAGSPWYTINGKRWSFRANDTTGYYLYLGNSGSPKVVVTGSSLGIGTDTPSANLDIVGNISASAEVSASAFYGDGSNLTGLASANSITDLVQDTSPQLGGTLDVNGQGISGSTVAITGSVVMGALETSGNFNIQGPTTAGQEGQPTWIPRVYSNNGQLVLQGGYNTTTSIVIAGGNIQNNGNFLAYGTNNQIRLNDGNSNGIFKVFEANSSRDRLVMHAYDKYTNFYVHQASPYVFRIVDGSGSSDVGNDYLTISGSNQSMKFSGSTIQNISNVFKVGFPSGSTYGEDDDWFFSGSQDGSNNRISKLGSGLVYAERNSGTTTTAALRDFNNYSFAKITGGGGVATWTVTVAAGDYVHEWSNINQASLPGKAFRIKRAWSGYPDFARIESSSSQYHTLLEDTDYTTGSVYVVKGSGSTAGVTEYFKVNTNNKTVSLKSDTISLSGSTIQVTGSLEATGSSFTVHNLFWKMNNPNLSYLFDQLYHSDGRHSLSYAYGDPANHLTNTKYKLLSWNSSESSFGQSGEFSNTGGVFGQRNSDAYGYIPRLKIAKTSDGPNNVSSLIIERSNSGEYTNGTGYPSGSYFYRIFTALSNNTADRSSILFDAQDLYFRSAPNKTSDDEISELNSDSQIKLKISQSGSILGGSLTDLHQITGSVDVSGSGYDKNFFRVQAGNGDWSGDLIKAYDVSANPKIDLGGSTTIEDLYNTETTLSITNTAQSIISLNENTTERALIDRNHSSNYLRIYEKEGFLRLRGNTGIQVTGSTEIKIPENNSNAFVISGSSDNRKYFEIDTSRNSGNASTTQFRLKSTDGNSYFAIRQGGNSTMYQVNGQFQHIFTVNNNQSAYWKINDFTIGDLFKVSTVNGATGSYQTMFKIPGTFEVHLDNSSAEFKITGSQGDLFSVTDSLSGSLFSVNDISGLPVLEAFSDNTIVMGDFAAPSLTTTARATINSPGGYVFSIPTGTYDGYYIDYTVVSSSLGDMRAGQIITIRSGSSYHYTEQTTADFGSTTAVSFNVEASGSNVSLYATASSGTYTVKAIVRAI